jgi:hypothetical protein
LFIFSMSFIIIFSFLIRHLLTWISQRFLFLIIHSNLSNLEYK